VNRKRTITALNAWRGTVLRRRHADRVGALLAERTAVADAEVGVRRWIAFTARSVARRKGEEIEQREHAVHEREVELGAVVRVGATMVAAAPLHETAGAVPPLLERLAELRGRVDEIREHFEELVALALPSLNAAQSGVGSEASDAAVDCNELLLMARAVDDRLRAIARDTAALDLDVVTTLRQSLVTSREFIEDIVAASAAAVGAVGNVDIASPTKLDKAVVQVVALTPLQQTMLSIGEIVGLREELRGLREGPVKGLRTRAVPLLKQLSATVLDAASPKKKPTPAVSAPPQQPRQA